MDRTRALLICILGLASFTFAQMLEREESIQINSEPISSFQVDGSSLQRFGACEFRGGLVLTSPNKAFGGISAMRVQQNGVDFIAVSDRTTWLKGRIIYKDSRPVGILDASMAPVLDQSGKPAPRQWDTESIAQDGDTLYVGMERIHSIARFDYGRDGLRAAGQIIPIPFDTGDLPSNQSFESLVFVDKHFSPGGTLIAISEKGLTEAGNIKGYLIGGLTSGMFSVRRTDGYDISDAATLPNGDLLILERQYSQERGISMRIRRILLADIKPEAVVDGPVVMEADKRHQIDNMEAISVHQDQSKKIILTLMSDNNHSDRQRTMLLQFVYNAETK